jgi:predicted nucleotidyltransferase
VIASVAVERRLRLAECAAAAFIANPHVAAVLVVGSVARGPADDRSDIELDVYWGMVPPDAERVTAVEGAGWERVYAVVGEDEWADGYLIDGVKVDTRGFRRLDHDGHLDAALLRADVEPERQVRITALPDGHVLHARPLETFHLVKTLLQVADVTTMRAVFGSRRTT